MSIREGHVALNVGHPRGTHSRYVIRCCLIPLGIYGLKNNSRQITSGIGCVWGMPSLSPLSSLGQNYSLGSKISFTNCLLFYFIYSFRLRMIYNNKFIMRAFFSCFLIIIAKNCLDLSYSNAISLPKCYVTKMLYKHFNIFLCRK